MNIDYRRLLILCWTFGGYSYLWRHAIARKRDAFDRETKVYRRVVEEDYDAQALHSWCHTRMRRWTRAGRVCDRTNIRGLSRNDQTSQTRDTNFAFGEMEERRETRGGKRRRWRAKRRWRRVAGAVFPRCAWIGKVRRESLEMYWRRCDIRERRRRDAWRSPSLRRHDDVPLSPRISLTYLPFSISALSLFLSLSSSSRATLAVFLASRRRVALFRGELRLLSTRWKR